MTKTVKEEGEWRIEQACYINGTKILHLRHQCGGWSYHVLPLCAVCSADVPDKLEREYRILKKLLSI